MPVPREGQTDEQGHGSEERGQEEAGQVVRRETRRQARKAAEPGTLSSRPMSNRNMPPTSALIAAVALSLYGLCASAQQAPPPAAPAQQVAGTSDEAITKAINSALNADP